jgi:hypothetical protein
MVGAPLSGHFLHRFPGVQKTDVYAAQEH